MLTLLWLYQVTQFLYLMETDIRTHSVYSILNKSTATLQEWKNLEIKLRKTHNITYGLSVFYFFTYFLNCGIFLSFLFSYPYFHLFPFYSNTSSFLYLFLLSLLICFFLYSVFFHTCLILSSYYLFHSFCPSFFV